MSDSNQGGGLASKLADRLREEAERVGGIRALARAIGLSSDSILHRIFSGGEVEPKTLNKIAEYLRLPPHEVYQMAEVLPAPDLADSELDPEQVRWLNQLYSIFSRLQPTDQRRFLEVAVWFPQLSESNQDVIVAMIRTLMAQQT